MGLNELLGGFPVLQTQRLCLREPRPEADARAHYQHWSDPEVLRFTPDSPATSEEDSLLALRKIRSWFYSPRETISWVITEKSDDRYIGGIGFYEFFGHKLQIAQVSFTLSRDHCGKGLATEALQAVVAYAFGKLWLQRIELMAHPQDESTVQAARQAGFTEEGLLRQYVYNGRTGGWDDQRLFSILRPEWEPTMASTP